MKTFLNFFREGTSESMTRLSTFIIVINSCLLSWVCYFSDKDMTGLILGMLGMVLTAKVTQSVKGE